MRPVPRDPVVLLGILDAGVLVAFAAIGRRSHNEGVAGLAVTAFPFVASWLILARVTGALRDRSLSLAALTWLAAWPLAMLLRAITGRGLAIGFLIVSFLFPLALLLGARFLLAEHDSVEPTRGDHR